MKVQALWEELISLVDLQPEGHVSLRLLFMREMQCTVAEFFGRSDWPLSEESVAKLRREARLLAADYPLHYLLGEREFYGLPFKVTPDVLIPRPETELLVERLLAYIRSREEKKLCKLLEIGTGSGVIALTLAKFLPEIEIFVTDISPNALAVCRENARNLGLEERTVFLEGDLFAPIHDYAEEMKFDIIVSNPPYLTAEEMERIDSNLRYEPAGALNGGVDGLDFYRRLGRESPQFLVSDGLLALEIGSGQGAAVQKILASEGFDGIEIFKDYADHERMVFGRR